MVTKHTEPAPAAIAELDREDTLYQEMIDRHHDEWFALASGRLFHSPDHERVLAMLQESRVDPASTVISYMGKPPFRVCNH